MAWTDERVEKLKQYWLKGFSASQCAALIGGFGHCVDGGRSAVIGKIHRIGMAGRTVTTRAQRNTPKRRPKKARSDTPHFRVFAAAPEPLVPAQDPHVVPLAKRVGVEGVEPDQCRWPYGDPRSADFHFCDCTKMVGLPYCEAHARRAARPATVGRPPVANAAEPVAEDVA